MDITVGDLIRQLQAYDKDAILSFGGLDFYRLKRRGEKVVQVEFNQQVYRDNKDVLHVEDFRKLRGS